MMLVNKRKAFRVCICEDIIVCRIPVLGRILLSFLSGFSSSQIQITRTLMTRDVVLAVMKVMHSDNRSKFQLDFRISRPAVVSMLERTLKSIMVPRLLSTIATVQAELSTSSMLPLMMESTRCHVRRHHFSSN